MTNLPDITREELRILNLDSDELEVYLELLKVPSTHLKLGRATGIARTKVYRIIERLAKRSLVSRRIDDNGSFLVASHPSALEVELIQEEESLKERRAALKNLVPALENLRRKDAAGFVVRTYEGYEGLRQMVWHEVRAKGDILVLGHATIEELVGSKRWAEAHRRRSLAAGNKQRVIVTDEHKVARPFTKVAGFMDAYESRSIPSEILPIHNQTVVYKNTVAIYYLEGSNYVGVEIHNESYAAMMRAMFESYWAIANKVTLVETSSL